MTLSFTDRLWNRLVSWWMHRHGAETIPITIDGDNYDIPVYPMTGIQPFAFECALMQLQGNGMHSDTLGAMLSIRDLTNEVCELPAEKLPTEVNIDILEAAYEMEENNRTRPSFVPDEIED